MKIKQYYPFIVPTISFLLVLFLAFRWYNLRTQRDRLTEDTEVEIENLTQDDLMNIQGASDVSTVDLEAEDEQPGTGQIRYKIDNDRVLITVNADLAQLDSSYYQVWFASEGKQPQRAFKLSLSKAGYMGSASVMKLQLPLEVMITDQSSATGEEMGKLLLKGTIQAEKTE